MTRLSEQPIKVKRGIQWRGGKYLKTFAWIELIKFARHQEIKWTVKNRKFILQRGQFFCRKSDLAKKWGWPRRTVQRFFKALEGEGKITQELFDGTGTLVEIIDFDNAANEALFKKSVTEFSPRKKRKCHGVSLKRE